MTPETTHRCHGSLVAHTPIRFEKRFQYMCFPDDKKAWRLFYVHRDDEYYDCVHVTPVAEITYCPFCGKKLEVDK